MLNRSFRACCAVWLAPLLLAGCGPSTGDVAGEVKYKGQALAGSTVTFYDANNKAISSVIDEQGKYEAKGVAVGKAKIAVLTPLPIGFGAPLPKSALSPVPPAQAEKLADPDKSGLALDVKGGRQEYPIALD